MSGVRLPPALRPYVTWVLKLGMTVVITWLALRKVPLGGLKGALAHLAWSWAALSLGVFVLGMTLLESARLYFAGALLREPLPRFRDWVRIYLESRPFYYILPAAVGAEGLVWLRLRQFSWRHASCGFVVLATRIWGMSAWSLVAAYALARPGGFHVVLARTPGWMQGVPFWASAGCALALASLLAPHILAGRRGIALMERRDRTIAAILLTTLGAVLVTGLAVLSASRATGTPLTLEQSLGLMAFFNFAMVLPFSLGGVGLQEALVLFLGLPLGYPPQALVAFSALIHLQRMALCGLGLGVFLWKRRLPSDGA